MKQIFIGCEKNETKTKTLPHVKPTKTFTCRA